MFDNLIFSINAVLPIFLVMLFGVFLKQIKIINQTGAKQMNNILFNFALPTSLFLDIAYADLSEIMDFPFIAYSVSVTFIWFFICWAVAYFFIKERTMKGPFVQGSFRSNYAIIGLPLVANILGYDPPKAAIITTFVIPIFNVFSCLILTIYAGEQVSVKDTLIMAAKNIVRNPIITGIFLGILFSLSGLKMPYVLGATIEDISDLSTPLALISIGASMDFEKVRQRMTPALGVCFLKLVGMPLLFMTIAFFMNMSAENLVILFVFLASPTAVSSYVMATNMGADEYLASNIILLTSLLSIFTFTIGIYVLKAMAVI
ncbi:MAG: AEC family transporter [Clostridiales bacterium]|nr:AEC family transporter [Clostridiales bacterium]